MFCDDRNGDGVAEIGRDYGSFTRVYESFTRVYESFTRVYESFTRVYESFTRVFDPFTRVWARKTRANKPLPRTHSLNLLGNFLFLGLGFPRLFKAAGGWKRWHSEYFGESAGLYAPTRIKATRRRRPPK